jgi:hypothetical protein
MRRLVRRFSVNNTKSAVGATRSRSMPKGRTPQQRNKRKHQIPDVPVEGRCQDETCGYHEKPNDTNERRKARAHKSIVERPKRTKAATANDTQIPEIYKNKLASGCSFLFVPTIR